MNPWIKHALQGIGGGTAIALGLAAIKAVENQPTFLPQLLSGNALVFAGFVICAVFFDRRLNQFTELSARHAAAQEQLALNVGALVAKDDQKSREQELLLDHIATQQNKILERLERLNDRA